MEVGVRCLCAGVSKEGVLGVCVGTREGGTKKRKS